MDLQRLSDFASAPTGHIVLVGVGMLLLSRGYPALVARWPGLAPYLGLLARLFPDAAPRSGEALWELYRSTMHGRAVNGKLLPAWADLDAAQRAAYDAMAQGLALAPPPPPAKDDDGPTKPKGPPGLVTLSIGVLWLSACAGLGCGSPISAAIVVANASRDAGEVAREELESRCVDGYRAAGDLDEVTRLDATCLPLRDAYRGLRGAHVVLVTAIQVAQVRGDIAALPAAMAATVQASELVVEAVTGGAR